MIIGENIMVNEYVFWGAGNHGALAAEIFASNHSENERIYGYIDSNKSNTFKEYKIVESEKTVDYKLIITVDDTLLILDIIKTARKIGYKEIYWFTGIRNSTTGEFITDYCDDCSNWGNLILPQAEMHIVDYCNLNCKGCVHFSPIFEKDFPDTYSRIRDIKILKDKFSHIIKFFLLGGEPFLNPEINTYITETRRILPNTMIQVVTNGLLIPQIDDNVLRVFHDNDIIVSISEYQPTYKMIRTITKRLEDNGVKYIIRTYDSKTVFNKPLSLLDNSIYEKKCISEGCVNIWNGMISRCPTLMYINKFNEVFGTELPNEGIYDLKELDGEQILEIINQTVPLCKHCVSNEIRWSSCGSSPRLEDFAERD